MMLGWVPDTIWLSEYPIRYMGTRFNARMTVIRLDDGGLMIHSPGPLDDALVAEIRELGEVAFIVAPGNFHHLHAAACQRRFPDAETWICPGVERKQPELTFTGVLGDEAPAGWAGQLDQVAIKGARWMREVVFYHRASHTLILVDLIENIGDSTPGTNWVLRLWWKGVFRMWNRPRPAPEYQLGWSDKAAAKTCLERILGWDFERVVLAHGDLIEDGAKDAAREAWRRVLEGA